jgi:hypothetical protein
MKNDLTVFIKSLQHVHSFKSEEITEMYLKMCISVSFIEKKEKYNGIYPELK